MTRRKFLKVTGALMAGLSCAPLINSSLLAAEGGSALAPFTRTARYFEKLPGRKVRCTLCPRECRVGNRERGYCGVRENHDGEYYTLVYGNPCSVNVDPIEKKPFFHFLPGTRAFSLSTAGCNLNCRNCQNWEISQARPENVQSMALAPKAAVAEAQKCGCRSIVGTYTEPTVFFEYMLDIAKEAKKKKLCSAIVSAGYIKPDPLAELCRFIDAIKIDLKSFDNDFYRKICVGELSPVLESLKVIKRAGVSLEIVYLVIPTLNDSLQKIKEMSGWIKKELGSDVPLHFTRFFPIYKLKNLPGTPTATLDRARDCALQAGLRYVYVGNVPGDPGENTYCHHCKKLVIERMSYFIKKNCLVRGKCGSCGTRIPGFWEGR
jgi:pyruvate formate lyase activating enzyme